MKVTRSFKIGNKLIRYIYEGPVKASEQRAIDKFIGIAYNMSLHAIRQIKANSLECMKFLKMVYGKDAGAAVDKLVEVYKSVIDRIEHGLKISRDTIFKDNEGNDVLTVLSSANVEKNVITIYDAFFKNAEGDEKGLNARGSVIIHELAHLAGLDGDEEEQSFESAEALRNFTLLVCEIVRPENLFVGDEDANEKNSQLEGENGELPNNPNHYPVGSPKGGQFAPKEGGDGGASSGDDKSSGDSSEKPEKESKNVKSEPEASAESKENTSSPKILQTPEELAENHKKIEDMLKDLPETEAKFTTPDESFSMDDDVAVIPDPNNPDQLIDVPLTHVWGMYSGEFKGEPNTDYTIWKQDIFEYTDPETGEKRREVSESAYNARSDENGNIRVPDMGLVNQDKANSVQSFKEGKLEITTNHTLIKGKVESNFGEPDRVQWNPEKDSAGMPNKYDGTKIESQEKYGLGSYAANHAQKTGGGGVMGRLPNNKPESTHQSKFTIDKDKKTFESSVDFGKEASRQWRTNHGETLKRIKKND